jgi:hypothetical protein
VPLEEGGWYFNTGTWVDGRDVGDGVPFTHLVVTQDDSELEATLCRWEEGSHPLFEEPGAIVLLPRDDSSPA